MALCIGVEYQVYKSVKDNNLPTNLHAEVVTTHGHVGISLTTGMELTG